MTAPVTVGDLPAPGGWRTGRAMAESHAHLNITQQEWDRMVVLFVGVLTKYQVPETETQELLAIIGSTKADIVIADAQ